MLFLLCLHYIRELQHAKEGPNWQKSANREVLRDLAHQQDRLQWVGVAHEQVLGGKRPEISLIPAVCLFTVYKVKVESITNELITDVYLMKIENVIKEGGSLSIPELLKKKRSSPLQQLFKRDIFLHVVRKCITWLFLKTVEKHSLPFCVLHVNHRDHWRGSPGKTAPLPELQAMQGGIGSANRQNVPLHGDVYRHT